MLTTVKPASVASRSTEPIRVSFFSLYRSITARFSMDVFSLPSTAGMLLFSSSTHSSRLSENFFPSPHGKQRTCGRLGSLKP
jgi:hypothetical protein